MNRSIDIIFIMATIICFVSAYVNALKVDDSFSEILSIKLLKRCDESSE